MAPAANAMGALTCKLPQTLMITMYMYTSKNNQVKMKNPFIKKL